MIGLIGKKIGMTQYFSDAGEAIPVTVIEVGPCTVTEVRTPERDGYAAIQLGFGANKESRYTRPVLGQFKKRNPSSIATGVISSPVILMLSPGITISVPSGRLSTPVTSVVRK